MQTSFSTILLNTVLIIILIWLLVLIVSLFSVSKRKDIIAPVKFFWAAVILFAPLAGLLVYLIYGPKKNPKALIK